MANRDGAATAGTHEQYRTESSGRASNPSCHFSMSDSTLILCRYGISPCSYHSIAMVALQPSRKVSTSHSITPPRTETRSPCNGRYPVLQHGTPPYVAHQPRLPKYPGIQPICTLTQFYCRGYHPADLGPPFGRDGASCPNLPELFLRRVSQHLPSPREVVPYKLRVFGDVVD